MGVSILVVDDESDVAELYVLDEATFDGTRVNGRSAPVAAHRAGVDRNWSNRPLRSLTTSPV
jgi:hypothetical protein